MEIANTLPNTIHAMMTVPTETSTLVTLETDLVTGTEPAEEPTVPDADAAIRMADLIGEGVVSRTVEVKEREASPEHRWYTVESLNAAIKENIRRGRIRKTARIGSAFSVVGAAAMAWTAGGMWTAGSLLSSVVMAGAAVSGVITAIAIWKLGDEQ
jgi:hypothetical protein